MNKTDIRGMVTAVKKISEKCWEIELELPQHKQDSAPEFAVVRLASAAIMSGPLLQQGHDVIFTNVKVGSGRSQQGKVFNGLTTFEPALWVHH